VRLDLKRALQILAVVLAVATLGLWLAKGANSGFTKDRVQVKTVDPVTEIEQVEWQQVFIPGVEFLGGGLIVAGALFGGSFFIRKQNKQQQTQNS
jgi:hypothetical protein